MLTPVGSSYEETRFSSPIEETSSRFAWDQRLTMELIRSHTKTDDIPGVDDIQLQLYRDAAIESAELYTGMLLSGQKTITEPVQSPHTPRPGRYSYIHRLQHPAADGKVYLYGAPHAADNGIIVIPPGTRKINVPIRTGIIDLSNCCDPCAPKNILNGGMLVTYLAGYPCVNAVPAGIVLGCLHFIAWVVEHPGDELLTMRNRLDSRGGAGVYGSNYVALVSGALEQWKTYTDDI